MKRNYVFYCRTSHLSLFPLPLSTRYKFLSHSRRSRQFTNRKIADVDAIRIIWQSRDTLMSTLKKNKRQKWQEKTRIASRERIISLLSDGSRLRFNYCAWLDLWLCSHVAFEKDYFFPVSESFRERQKFEIKLTYWKRSLKDEFACALIYSGTIHCKLQSGSWIFKSVCLIEKLNEFLRRDGLFKSSSTLN